MHIAEEQRVTDLMLMERDIRLRLVLEGMDEVEAANVAYEWTVLTNIMQARAILRAGRMCRGQL